MSDHYYSAQPQSAEKTETNQYIIRDKQYSFTSGAGVFSKKGIDFGSQLLIETFQLPDLAGDVLDMGCGYGPIGLVIASHYQERKIVMVDINERAIQLAKKNAHQNDIRNVAIKQSEGFSQVQGNEFAAIVTNPPIRAGKKVIYDIFAESFRRLRSSGELWIVIQKKQGAPSAMKFLAEMFAEVTVVEKKKGYYIIKAKKG